MSRGNGDAELFVILYLFTSAYFAGMMRRMLLVLAPAAAVVAGTGISAVLRSDHPFVPSPAQTVFAGTSTGIPAVLGFEDTSIRTLLMGLVPSIQCY
jgi:asparagine N-glycosylation enzyme membrane subunit Stt3